MKYINGIEVLTELAEQAAPRHTALIIVDMVNDLCHPDGKAAAAGRDLSHNRSIIPALQRLTRAARQAGVTVVHAVHTTLKDHASSSGPWLAARQNATYSDQDICLDGTWGQEPLPELEPAEIDLRVRKFRYSAFVGTDLDLLLRSRGVKTCVVTGCSTNVCVEATARDAFSHEYYTILPEDCLASWNRDLHNAALETARRRYATVCTSSELIELWTGAGQAAGS